MSSFSTNNDATIRAFRRGLVQLRDSGLDADLLNASEQELFERAARHGITLDQLESPS